MSSFIKRVYDWMKNVAGNILLEKEEEIVWAKQFFVTRDGLAVFHTLPLFSPGD